MQRNDFLVLGLHSGEQEYIPDGSRIGQQHYQAVHTKAQTAGGGHAVLQRSHKVIVHLGTGVRLLMAFRLYLPFKARLLINGVVQLAEGIAVLGSADKYSNRSVKAGSSGLRLASGLFSTG